MAGERAKLKDGAPHPFINPNEFKPFIKKLEAAFEKALAGQ
jgi:metallo-beta-lactamase class B